VIAAICGAAGGPFVLFLCVWQLMTPTDRRAVVPYSDFIAEVRAGDVDEIKIHDREIAFRVRSATGASTYRDTVGPVPDQALVASLKPDDPAKAPPKIVFEK
jgi:ATP-dependent Zn protease